MPVTAEAAARAAVEPRARFSPVVLAERLQGVVFRIVLPLSVPALASLIIFQFLWVWNDLLVALIYVGGAPTVAPMTVTLANLTNSLGQDYQLLTAAAFLSMVIPLIVFLSLQRYFVRGILAGSVKG